MDVNNTSITEQADHDQSHDPQAAPSTPLSRLILSRHTTRAFHPTKPVPQDVLEKCLELAQQTASSTNFQPWRLHFISGKLMEDLKSALRTAVENGHPNIRPEVPEQFRTYRSEIGHSLYGKDGYNIPRSDKEGKLQAEMRNYDFFDAPLVAIVTIPRVLTGPGNLGYILSVGLYIQSLLLLFAEAGLGTALQVAPAGYPDIVSGIVGGMEDEDMICTLDIGWEDESIQVNKARAARDQWKMHVTFAE